MNGILKRRRSSCKAFVHELGGLKLPPSEQARGQGWQKVAPGALQAATAAVGIAQECYRSPPTSAAAAAAMGSMVSNAHCSSLQESVPWHPFRLMQHTSGCLWRRPAAGWAAMWWRRR